MLRLTAWIGLVSTLAAGALHAAAPIVVDGAYPATVALGAARFRGFPANPPAQTGQQRLFLGVPDVGIAAQRVESVPLLQWEIGVNDVSFTYDAAGDRLLASVSNARGAFSAVYPNFAANAAAFKSTLVTPADLNFLQIFLRGGGTGTATLSGVLLNGATLGTGTFAIPAGGTATWTADDQDPASSPAFANGFTLTGTLTLAGAFSTSAEGNRLELSVGVYRRVVYGKDPASTGDGTVNAGAAPACGGGCNRSAQFFAPGLPLALAAAPDGTSTFAQWNGSGSGATACTGTNGSIVLPARPFYVASCLALFNGAAPPAPPTLTLRKAGSGSGTIAAPTLFALCDPDCAEKNVDFTRPNALVTATPASGSIFAGWSGAGCVDSTAASILVAQPAPGSEAVCVARFELALPAPDAAQPVPGPGGLLIALLGALVAALGWRARRRA